MIYLDAFYSSELHAEYAKSVKLSFVSNANKYASVSSDFYIPDWSEFNCYGEGCNRIGNVYLGDGNASQLTFNLNSCGQCSNVSDCFDLLRFYCSGNSKWSTFYGLIIIFIFRMSLC